MDFADSISLIRNIASIGRLAPEYTSLLKFIRVSSSFFLKKKKYWPSFELEFFLASFFFQHGDRGNDTRATLAPADQPLTAPLRRPLTFSMRNLTKLSISLFLPREGFAGASSHWAALLASSPSCGRLNPSTKKLCGRAVLFGRQDTHTQFLAERESSPSWRQGSTRGKHCPPIFVPPIPSPRRSLTRVVAELLRTSFWKWYPSPIVLVPPEERKNFYCVFGWSARNTALKELLRWTSERSPAAANELGSTPWLKCLHQDHFLHHQYQQIQADFLPSTPALAKDILHLACAVLAQVDAKKKLAASF